MATESSRPQDGAGPRGDAEPSIGDLVRDVSTNMSTLVRGEIELAKLELSGLVRRVATGGALFVVALGILLFSLVFPFVALAEGLVALGLPRWAAYLVVWAVLLLLAGLSAFVGYRMLKKAKKPERTLETVRDTAKWARRPTRSSVQDG